MIRILRPSCKKFAIFIFFGILFGVVLLQQHRLDLTFDEIKRFDSHRGEAELAEKTLENVVTLEPKPKGPILAADRIKQSADKHLDSAKGLNAKKLAAGRILPPEKTGINPAVVKVTNDVIKPRKLEGGNIVFLHVAKSAGTALSDFLSKNVALKSRSQPANNVNGYILVNKVINSKHFDWSVIDQQRDLFSTTTIEVLALLRHPVDRAISHFNFVKRDRGWATKLLQGVTIEDFLNNHKLMMEIRGIWQDGQASVSWLTGTHIGDSWVLHNPAKLEKDKLETEALDARRMLVLAADRLESTLWLGLREELEKSIELLHYQLPNSVRPNQEMRDGINKLTYAKPSDEVREKLSSLMPMDGWLYAYAKRLFHARYQFFKTGTLELPERPPFPDISCRSTRYVLMCNNGPYAPLLYKWDRLNTAGRGLNVKNQESHYEQFRKILYNIE